MRFSPSFMGIVYILIGVMFTYLAIQNVGLAGWNLWTYFFIALAAIDFMIGIRFIRMRKHNQQPKE